MTNEEAKRRLLDIERCTPINTRDDVRDFEALEIAISALDNKTPCSLCRFRNEDTGICDMCPAMPYCGAKMESEGMTVAKLIEQLKQMPQDVHVYAEGELADKVIFEKSPDGNGGIVRIFKAWDIEFTGRFEPHESEDRE